jgi:hypothetical protein
MMKVDALWEPHRGVILQSATGEELRPLFGRTLSSSPSEASEIPSVLRPSGGAFKPLQGATRGEL